MTLTHQTSVATFIQFVIVSLFTIVTQLVTTVNGCRKESVSNCLGDLTVAIIFYIFVAVVFGAVWLIGYMAQDKRSKRWTQLLLCVEGFFALLALFSIKLNTSSRSFLGSIASFVMLLLSVWIISLALRLLKAGNQRVTRRRRPHHPNEA